MNTKPYGDCDNLQCTHTWREGAGKERKGEGEKEKEGDGKQKEKRRKRKRSKKKLLHLAGLRDKAHREDSYEFYFLVS